MHAAVTYEWDKEKDKLTDQIKFIDDITPVDKIELFEDLKPEPYGFQNVEKMSFNEATRNADSYGTIFWNPATSAV
jgi:hypothetical protein